MNNLWIYYPEGHEKHQQPGHPERPARVEAVRAALQANGFWDPAILLESEPINFFDLENIHSPSYLQKLANLDGKQGQIELDTYYQPASIQLALNAAGGAVAVARQVQQTGGIGLALCRPPGHHAVRETGMGFCLLNNAAAAADYLCRTLGTYPVAIIDIDLHHGNGIQDIFWENPDVHYLSTHQYPFYPGTGSVSEKGYGKGLGTNLNIPVNSFAGDSALIEAAKTILLPYLEKVKPRAVLISLGFDGHWMDPLGELTYSEEGFFEFFKLLSAWVRKENLPGISLYLEGGYSLDASAQCMLASLAGCLGKKHQTLLGKTPEEEFDFWQDTFVTIKSEWNL